MELVETLGFVGGFHNQSAISDEMRLLVMKMLAWPLEFVVPVLDLARVFFAHSGGVDLGDDPRVQQLFLQYLESKEKIQTVLIVRALTNWIAKRRKPLTNSGVSESLTGFLCSVFRNLAYAARDSNSTLSSAYVMLSFKYDSFHRGSFQ